MINHFNACLTFAGILTWASNNAHDAQTGVLAFARGAGNRLFSSDNAWAINAEFEGVRLGTGSVGSSAGVFSFIVVGNLAKDEVLLGDNSAGASSSPLNLWSWVSTGRAGLSVFLVVFSFIIGTGGGGINVYGCIRFI